MIRKPWTKKRVFSQFEITSMVYLYESGHSLAEVAKEYRSTAPTVSKAIRANGGTIRPRGFKRNLKVPIVVFKKKEKENADKNN